MTEAQKKEFDAWVDEREKELFKVEKFKELGKSDDYVYQALSFLGNGSWQLALASTLLRDEPKVSEELKLELKEIQRKLGDFQEKLRSI